jgi:hypothetical protein
MNDKIRVRVVANARFPHATRVELILNGQTIDLTEEGVVQWPIVAEVNEDGVFAVLKLPLENITIVD